MHSVRAGLRVKFQIGLRVEESRGSRRRWRNKRVGSIDRQDLIGENTQPAKTTPGAAQRAAMLPQEHLSKYFRWTQQQVLSIQPPANYLS